MYRINFGYYKRGESFGGIGQLILGSVAGETLKEANDAYWDVYMHHDCMEFTEMIFTGVEEVKG